MQSKTCNRCKQIKVLEQFATSKYMKTDGHVNTCKECYRTEYHSKKAMYKDREIVCTDCGVKTRDHYATSHNLCRKCHSLLTSRYHFKNKEKLNENSKRYYDTHYDSEKATAKAKKFGELYPDKQRARWSLHDAVKRGKITRLPCEVCGNKSEAHHPDYSKPLEVKWLCKKHHAFEHTKHKENIVLSHSEDKECNCHCHNNHEGMYSGNPEAKAYCKCWPNCIHCNKFSEDKGEKE